MIMPGVSTSPMAPSDAMRAGLADLAQGGGPKRLRPGCVADGSRVGPHHRPKAAAAAAPEARYDVARCWQPSFSNRFIASLPLQSP